MQTTTQEASATQGTTNGNGGKMLQNGAEQSLTETPVEPPERPTRARAKARAATRADAEGAKPKRGRGRAKKEG